MTFYTACEEPRPIRLPEALRQWAWDSLHGKYGDEAMQHPAVSMDDIPGFAEWTDLQKYDAALRRIVSAAPLRICPEEPISGAATLGMAIRHQIPATLNGVSVMPSLSHLTMNYYRTVHEGVNSYAAEIAVRKQDPALSERQKEFLASLENVIDCMHIWHDRYLEATKDVKPEIHAMLQQVPFGPARNFREAVQSLWFEFAFARLCGNWPGIGRIDWILGDYLKRDLAENHITLQQARELLAGLFIKGCEWIESDTVPGSGDAQHYQNIVLAGVGPDGKEVANEVTDLVLDIVEELSISDFPISLRVNADTPKALLRHAAAVMRHGGGVVAVYNEALIMQAMQRAGYPQKETLCFANDGCWEVQVPGATCFGYMPFDGLQIFNRAIGVTGCEEDEIPLFNSIDEVYDAFQKELKKFLVQLHHDVVRAPYVREADGGWKNNGVPCSSLISLFEDGCIDAARCYYDFGPRYTVRSPHLGGAPDVGNSLYAIQKLVFEEKRISWRDLVMALRNDWADRETTRLYARNRYTYYGNDNEADDWVAKVLNDFAGTVVSCAAETTGDVPPIRFVPGISTFGRQLEWRPARCATAFGAHKGEILAGNDSPTPGTDSNGATAIIRSYCKADLTRQTTGAALDIKLFPGSIKGETGLDAIVSLIDGFCTLGGFFMQIDVIDAEVLKAAQKDPKAYKTLSVRVSGWNARFVTLDKEWQQMIIERTAQNV